MFNKQTIIVSDIESNGLLDTVDKFHCAVNIDYFTGEEVWYRPWDFAKYIADLEQAAANGAIIAGHNFIKYDYQALKKLKKMHLKSNLNIPRQNILDTLVVSRLIYSNLKELDLGLVRSGKLNGKYMGSHSLKAWGFRLGEYKGDYGQQEDAWEVFNEPMMEYCAQDVRVTVKLLRKFFDNTWYFADPMGMSESVRLEHDTAWLMAKQERNGYPFATKDAEKLYFELVAKREEIGMVLLNTFGSWYKAKGGTTPFTHPRTGKVLDKYPRVKIPKAGGIYLKDGKKKDKRLYCEGRPFTPVTYVSFNPASRDHLIKVLTDLGWEPTEFTDAGNPTVDDETLGLMIEHKIFSEDICEKIDLIREYLVNQKLIGQLAEGDKAWLRFDKGGYIHGSVNPNGAVTGRATHSFPNMAQVPSIRKYKGVECRSLFGAAHHIGTDGKPWVQVGIDASGLELRCLGHFMARFDDGAYIDVILNGDIHTLNQNAAGLPTRDNAKTFIYGFLYGAGAEKIGQIVGKFGDAGKKAGKALTEAFLSKTPAIATLREVIAETLIKDAKWVGGVQEVKWKRKWIKGLDGRKVHVRSPHAALNTLLQSAGGLICKKWIVVLERMLIARGYRHGWDGDFAYMAWVHDEVQIACRNEEVAEIVKGVAQEAMRLVGEEWNFRCPLDTEGKIGPNWAVCH